jgi:hypothetical protein
VASPPANPTLALATYLECRAEVQLAGGTEQVFSEASLVTNFYGIMM